MGRSRSLPAAASAGAGAADQQLEQIETAIAILERVRAAGHLVRLRIIGGARRRRYLQTIREIAGARTDWITLHLHPSRSELLALLRRSKYGIHATPDEHFGIAPAELARAGCIVFVHDSGGQVEVVGRDSRLTWRNIDHAVSRIIDVLTNDALQRELQQKLLAHSAEFSFDRFRDQIRAIVATQLGRS